jgi:dTDP-4-amino-4,6-dideoxygalactose transaminase
MNEISAAAGITAFDSLEEFIRINQKNYFSYRENLSGIPGIKLIGFDESQKNNYQYIVIDIKENLTGISRDDLLKILHAENIRARRYFFPGCHKMEPYVSYYPNASLLLPVTEKISRRTLCLPTGASINSEIIINICNIIRFVVENGSQISQMLPSAEIHND